MNDLDKIIDEAYKLYMPQDRYEITELCEVFRQNVGVIKNSESFNVLEIGTKYGGTFYLWNKLLDAIQEDVYGMEPTRPVNRGMCISIDMNDGGQHGGISNEEMDKRDLWFQERFDNVHFIRGDSHSIYTQAECARVLHRGEIFGSNSENRIDFLFIDGDHTYEGVKMDFEMYSPFVKTGGIIAFHDIVISDHHHSRNVYVGEFWKELVDSGKYDTFEINSNLDWAGIGVIVM